MHSTSPQHAASPAARGRIRTASRAVALAVAVLVAAACDGADAPTEPSEEIRAPTPRSAVIPSDGELATVTHGPTTLTFWPWTGRGPDTDAITDPINLIFAGDAGPRAIRAALTALDGNRPAPFPPAFPFDCAWKDAMARPQASYGEEEGWTGSAVQLECGEYDPIRFHLRLFDVGEWTVANAHLDLLIPGTSEHQVIAWEAAEKLVAFDIMRTGLLDEGPVVTEPINAAPSWRAIPAPIYDGIPAALKAFIGGPPASGGNPVEIGTDGRATLLTLAGSAPPPAARVSRGLTVPFDQIVPRPVCSTAPGDFVHLEGSVELTLSVGVSRSGNYRSRFSASGRIDVTPVNPVTGDPIGESYEGQVQEHHLGRISASGTFVESHVVQIELPPGSGNRGRLKIEWITGIGGTPRFTVTEDC